MVKTPLKSKRAMEEEDGIVDSGEIQIRSVTLETLFEMRCARGEGIRLEMLEGNPGESKLTSRQIKAAIRAAMRCLACDIFMLTFKRGDRCVVQHQANNPWIIGDAND